MKMLRKNAFTLIELLVVIAIIALLMSIIVPALRRVKEQATGAICVSNTHQLSIAWHTYAMENNNEIVPGHIPTATKATRQDGITYWVEPPQDENGVYRGDATIVNAEYERIGIERGALFPYTQAVEVYKCPGDKSTTRFSHISPNGAWLNSYSITGLMNGEQWNDSKLAKKVTNIKAPGSKVVFLENMDSRGWAMGSWIMNYTAPRWDDPIAIWHKDRGSLGFADGHSEMHHWVDQSTLENAEGNPDGTLYPLRNPTPRSNETWDDIRFMQRSYVPGGR
jgi:prepilin-type N-terminal cleavage/methylation domain-containing protein